MDALPGGPRRDRLDLEALGIAHQFIVAASGREQVIIGDGLRRLRLDVRAGTLTCAPARLRYALEGFDRLAHQLETLRVLVAMRRMRRMPADFFARRGRAARWLLHLRVGALRNHGSARQSRW